MKKVHRVILYFLLVMAIIIAALAYYAFQPRFVLYVGDGCPHCAIVEEYMKNNSISTKLPITIKEVWHNQVNNVELGRKAVACGLDPNKVGIPMLVVDGRCIGGDVDITAYFKEKMGQ